MDVVANPLEKNARCPGEEEAAVSSAEENEALVRRLCEAIDEGNFDAMRELLAPDFVDHGLLPGQKDPGREAYIQSIAEQLPALSSHRTTIEYQATDEDKVITHYTSRSIHDRGPLFGIPQPARSGQSLASSSTAYREAGS